ncbi:hypothetical protein CC85DRAFT_282855 [Cutaneotrichosporon oleaginosum]|uniref:RING-type domain-containing protein n=1 Tax=Cutaneotrichosporon oleaginosum TaxID=879819 RepID=A0A0J0XWD2_9TREE|nr:uncharacterized protein CC85DRAFT_282855 [Cutaneotrichosporon oleaginosum]KLT45368.1 hypothetical protein CC85DRAFT_282855 [Cutaneotrichosporon oleaginosum]TXT14808.1 hypothetical protein COLE_01001 [Cutaneotrichosporon oleaginosum]
MGANQSLPARRQEEAEPRPTLRRRISTFLRRDHESQNASKRERSNSAHNSINSPGPKRRRVDGDAEALDGDDSMSSEPIAGPSSSHQYPTRPSLPFPRTMPSSGISTPTSPDTPASPATDELLSDRLRSVSTIRDSLAPEWTPQPGLISRLRRRDSPAVSSAASTSSAIPPPSAAPPPPPPPRTLSHRLSAIMGFAAPERSPSNSSIPSSSSQQPPTPATEAPPPAEEEGRIPVGAVLVIQGLAQTRANHDETGGSHSQVDLPSIDQQARMIGNLLTVAAAATATTLLSPESLSSQPSRSTAQSAMQTIMERLRPQRNQRHQSVEAALGEYLRTVLRDNRRFAEAVAPNAANVPAEFQDFLGSLQQDLMQAVRAYAVHDAAGEEGDDDIPAPSSSVEETSTGGTRPTGDLDASATTNATSSGVAEPPSPNVPSNSTIPTFHRQLGQNLPGAHRPLGVSGGSDGEPRRLNFFRAHLFPTVHADGSVVTPNANDGQEEAIVPSIFVGVRSIAHNPSMTTEDLVAHPSFPFMDGQVPEDAGAAAPTATGSSPATSPVATTQALPDDDHDFDRDLEQELSAAPAAGGTTVESRPRRSLRTRVLERLGARREPRASPPLNTYLIYVIGGNYPSSHPVLSIPSLVSGGPLTTEDLQLLAELLGPAKPPTVTQEEIEASGLKVIKANTLAQAIQDGQVLDSSTERCMVCLCDYEDDEDCRVLKCRHAFHKPCVDQWLSSGRNSCPTCRTEAVEKGSTPTTPEVEDADAVA